jgi:hypothetical protein
MAASDPQTAARVARLGLGLIGPTAGLAALEGALAAAAPLGGGGGASPVVAAVPFLWGRIAKRLGNSAPSLFAETLADKRTGPSGAEAASAVPPLVAAAGAVAASTAAETRLLVDETVTSILGRQVGVRFGLMQGNSLSIRNVLPERGF